MTRFFSNDSVLFALIQAAQFSIKKMGIFINLLKDVKLLLKSSFPHYINQSSKAIKVGIMGKEKKMKTAF